MTDYKIQRGPWGKPWVTRDHGPLLWEPGADKPSNGYLYERPSDISGNLDTKENLSPYHQCQAVTGLMLDSAHGGSLAMQFKALVSEHGLHTWERAKGDAKDLLRQARAKGGEEWKSGRGSGFHRYAHLVDEYGATWRDDILLPEKALEPWLAAYHEAMQAFEVLDDECFIVADDLDDPEGPDDIRCAGNFDRLLRAKRDLKMGKLGVIPAGTVLIGDIKSGASDPDWAMKPSIQVAVYSHGVRYEQETGRRWPIHEELSQQWGVLIHVPVNGDGDPCCDIYPLDLTEGWRLAQMSADITKARKMKCYKRDALVRTKA